jgi:hypothetical protein
MLESIAKYKWWIVGALGLVAAYLLYKRYSTSAQSTGDLSSETQFQQLQSAQQLANDQYQSQLDLVGAQAQAQTQVINATYSGQSALEQVGATSYDQYLQTQTQLNNQNNQTQVDLANIQAGTYEDVAGLQTSVYQSLVDQQNQVNQFNEGIVQGALSKWKNPTSNDVALLVSAIQGQGPQESVAQGVGSYYSGVGSAAQIGSFLNPAAKAAPAVVAAV